MRVGAQPSVHAAWKRLVIYLLLLGVGATCLFPFAWLVRSSLMSDTQMFVSPPEWLPDPFLPGNYVGALTSQPFLRYFVNTMTIELLVVPGLIITCSAGAFVFARLRWRGRNVIFAILLSGLMLPYAASLIPTFVMWQELGLVGTYAPLTVPAWFAGGAGGMFNVFLFRQFFLTIPRELDEAAYLDGASPWAVYWRIILPLSTPALTVVAVFTFIGVWNDFLNPLIYLSDSENFTLALGLATFKGLYTAQWGYLMAASTVVIAPIIIVFFIAQRRLLEGIALTGLKG